MSVHASNSDLPNLAFCRLLEKRDKEKRKSKKKLNKLVWRQNRRISLMIEETSLTTAHHRTR